MREIPAHSVNCAITSPPYYGHRDYGVSGQLGSEKQVKEYIDRLVEIFSELRRVVRSDGVFWLNIGDTYGKRKQLLGVPWRVAFALQDEGWILRNEVIWHKPNILPSPAKDRCTVSHETIFLFAHPDCGGKYYYDAEAVKEDAVTNRMPGQRVKETKHYGSQNGGNAGLTEFLRRYHKGDAPKKRNRRTVWTVPPVPFKGAHFATFPPALVEPMILAGAPEGGLVLDPFAGACTTGVVALKHGRRFLGIELSPTYAELGRQRILYEALGAVEPSDESSLASSEGTTAR